MQIFLTVASGPAAGRKLTLEVETDNTYEEVVKKIDDTYPLITKDPKIIFSVEKRGAPSEEVLGPNMKLGEIGVGKETEGKLVEVGPLREEGPWMDNLDSSRIGLWHRIYRKSVWDDILQIKEDLEEMKEQQQQQQDKHRYLVTWLRQIGGGGGGRHGGKQSLKKRKSRRTKRKGRKSMRKKKLEKAVSTYMSARH